MLRGSFLADVPVAMLFVGILGAMMGVSLWLAFLPRAAYERLIGNRLQAGA
jgi:hypothetical protein